MGKFFVLALLSFFSIHSSFAKTSLNSSLLMFSEDNAKFCPQKLQKILKLKNPRVLFLPTLFAVPKGKGISSYRSHTSDVNQPFVPMTEQKISFYEQAWTQCFKVAAQNNIKVTIMPHLDEAADSEGLWRNHMKFDPLKKYDHYTYDEIMIRPLVRALEAASFGDTDRVDFFIQGEMGATLFTYPQSNLALVRWVKSRHPPLESWRGSQLQRCQWRSEEPAESCIQELFNNVAIVGISAYAALGYPVKPQDFGLNVTTLYNELESNDVKLPAQVQLQFSEIGLGGGQYRSDGKSPAKNPAIAAKNPWAGNLYPYDPLQ